MTVKELKKPKERLPRKMKKAMAGLLILPDDGHVINKWRLKNRRYPHTKWVERAERELRRLWLELKRKECKIAELERENKELEMRIGAMKGVSDALDILIKGMI